MQAKAHEYDVPRHKEFLTPTMTAAFRIWLKKSRDSTGRKLWASGSTGAAHLVLYLLSVCGFHVTVRLKQGGLCSGDKSHRVGVVI